jgi:hypothetical protein
MPVPQQIINNSSQHPSELFGLSKELFVVNDIREVGEESTVEPLFLIGVLNFSPGLEALISPILSEISNGPRT